MKSLSESTSSKAATCTGTAPHMRRYLRTLQPPSIAACSPTGKC